MKRMTSVQYKDGIQSLQTFSNMLEEALREAMPGMELERESAYAWRGYQIENYPGLKDSQYYCQIYLSSPNILAFFEYYEMSHHPFQAEVDLAALGFFILSTYEDQKKSLVEFIKQASTEAIAWNASQRRQQVVPERLQ